MKKYKIIPILLILGLLFSACSKEKKLTITDVSFSSSKAYSLDQQSIKRKLLGTKVGITKFDDQIKINFYNSKNIVEESFILDKLNSNHTIIIMKASSNIKVHYYLIIIYPQFQFNLHK